MDLRIVDFSAAYLPHVQRFECGPGDWCQLAERWIKSAVPFRGALHSMEQYGNAVWLYFLDALDEEFFVGFSSLGVTKWPIPPPDGQRREVGFIPMLAVASRFQGKPSCGGGKHYIETIMEHVTEQARERGYKELCLFVHADNTRAIRLYNRHGFRIVETRNDKGLLKMLRLLD